jgi:hypothetical protein
MDEVHYNKSRFKFGSNDKTATKHLVHLFKVLPITHFRPNTHTFNFYQLVIDEKKDTLKKLLLLKQKHLLTRQFW